MTEKVLQYREKPELDLIHRIMETSPAGITLVNTSGQIIFANSKAEQILGLTRDRISHRTYNGPEWKITRLDGSPFPDEQLPFRQVMETGLPVNDVRHAIEWPDGRQVCLSINGTPLSDPDGHLDGVVFTIEDITGQIQADARLHHLNTLLLVLRNINKLMVREKDRHTLIRSVCENLTETRGFPGAWIALLDEQQKLIDFAGSGFDAGSLQEILQRNHLPGCAAKAFSSEEVFRAEIIPDQCRECPLGEQDRLQEAMSVRMSCDDRIFGVITVYVPPRLTVDRALFAEVADDLAFALHHMEQEEMRHQERKERKRLESRLRHVEKMEAIGTMAGGIAHDFNNILSVIIGQAQLLEIFDIPEESPVRSGLEEILSAANRARTLVQQMLTFSRRKEEKKEPVYLSPLIKETVKFIRSSLPSTIRIRSSIADDTGMVIADPTQIQQILLNLCANAAHAMEATGGLLRVDVDNTELAEPDLREWDDLSPGRYLRLTVTDSGTGMTPDVLQRIFDPYFTTRGAGEGTGLGLSVVHGMVREHGGAIRAESVPGRGSRFSIYLPQTTASRTESVLPASEIRPLPGGHEHILLVDDEPALVRAVQAILIRLGYRVTAKTKSAEALAAFRNEPAAFDLVITDLTMPGLTGIELFHAVQKIREGIPVMICTGFSEKLTREAALGIGLSEFIPKPVDADQLAVTIRRLLDKSVQ